MPSKLQTYFGKIKYALVATAFVLLFAITSLTASLSNRGVSAATNVQHVQCTLEAQPGRIVVDFFPYSSIRSNQSISAATKGPLNTSIPAGKYKVTLQSFDGHSAKSSQVQPNEKWHLILKNAATTVVATTNPISDLPDDKDTLTEVVNSGLAVSEAVTSATAFHSAYPDSSSPNSIYPVCAALDPVAEEVRGQVVTPKTLGISTQVQAPTGAVNAGEGTNSIATTSVLGLGGSLTLLGYAISRLRRQQQ